MAHSSGRLQTAVLFYRPLQEAQDWTQAELWANAKSIPGVRVLEDPDNEVGKSFGVFTSGQTLLYDAEGRLAFRGGINAFRGHSGDNAGRSAVMDILRGLTPSFNFPVTTPVFGCSLRGPA